MLKQNLFYRLFATALLLFGVLGWGQTTVSHTFTATSGALDANIAFTTQKNGGTTNPTINGGLRLYYSNTNSNTNGCSITMTPSSGAIITECKLYTTGGDTPTVRYQVDDATFDTSNPQAALSGTTYTITSVNAANSLKIRNANTTNKLLRITSIEVTYTLPITCTPPTTQSTTFSSSNISTSSAQINWVRGNGDNVLVVAREGSAVNAAPVSGTAYTGDPALGLGAQIGTGNFVVYNGPANTVTLTDLLSNKNYHLAIYEYNNTGNCYNTTNPLVGNFTTLSCFPTTQSTTFSSTNISTSSAQINWVRGNGDNVLVVAREGSAVNAAPVSGTTYIGDPALGLGDQIGTGNFVVYNGPANTVTLTDLLSNKNYHLAIYEYNNTGNCYNTTNPLVGNFTTLSCFPTTQSTTFSSTNISTSSAQINWVRGNGDNVLVVAREGSAVNAAPVSGTSYVGDPALGLGDQIGTGNFVVYNGPANTVTLTDLLSNKNYHIAIYEYNNADNCYNTTSPLVGNFATLVAPADHIEFVNVPSSALLNTNLASFTVQAKNSQNSVDTNYSGSVTLSKVSGSGTLSGTLTQSFVNGIATFNDIKFDAQDTYTISAATSGFTTITSGNIMVSNAIVYKKITSLTDLTDGEYVIADANDAVIATNGLNSGVFTTVASNANNGQIVNPSTNTIWNIIQSNGVFTIQSVANLKYLGYNSSTNLNAPDSVTDNNQRWSITYNTDHFTVANVGTSTRILKYNSALATPGFKAYTSSTQSPEVSLYKKVFTTTWQSTNSWSNGTPSATKDAVIDAAYSGAGFTANSVTVNAGKSLEISSDAVVTGAVTNNGSITVKDGANFKHSSYSGSGTFTLEKATTADANKYVFWSSPVAAQNMYSIYTSPSPFVMAYNTATDYYDTLANPTAAAFGTGYSVKVPVAQGLATFTGTPNNGTQSVTINNTTNSNGNAYNLIGNPYPTNLDLAAFYLENLSNVGETFYFWNSSTGNNTTQTGAATGNPGWAVYNANTTTWSAAASGSNEIIRPGQAFIVKGLTTSVVFNNDMRTTTNTGVSFLNRAANTTNNGKYWLQMTNPANTYTTIAVTYGQGASNAFDAYDSKMMSIPNDAIYTTVSDKKLAIQGRADFVNTDMVVLGNKFAAAGNYTISLAKVSGLFENGQAIYLRDKQLNTYTDLTSQAYTFVSTTGEFTNRFEIVYQPQGSLATAEVKKDELKVYRNAEVFVVENSTNIDAVVVLDAAGRVVKSLKPQAKKAQFELNTKGVYLVKVISGGKEQSKKIIK
ncbi:T9SS type A sorting domain-containing protein [Amniculibacterium sp. G2-70]|uniref:T9SS type A sorting domain-containing protein n=1 Tax=Amniculibacterium sp. G2-70 TaxID=2767188 RepID=UPI0016543EFD|nr:T9SS type A sorting domain-containing protein [Amniculibacterium sp. G2-70]